MRLRFHLSPHGYLASSSREGALGGGQVGGGRGDGGATAAEAVALCAWK